MYLEFFAALLRAPDALQRYSSRRERRLQELAGADSDELAAGATPVQAWAIGQAMLVGLQIEKRLACWPTSTRSSKGDAQYRAAGCCGGIPAVSLAG
jgi:hypothetical protein